MGIMKKGKKEESKPMSEKPSLAIAIGIKKAPKKMAKGGPVKSIDPEDKQADTKEIKENSGDKPAKDDSWTSPTWKKYGNSMSVKPSRPPGALPVGGHKVKVRDQEWEQEEDLQKAAPTGSFGEKPPAKYMADGGQVGLDEEKPHTGETAEDMLRRHADELAAAGYMAPRPSESEYMGDKMAKGGEVKGGLYPGEEEDESPGYDIYESIKRKRMADGGEVDLEANSEESPNMADEYNLDANGKEQYDLSDLDEQPEDSNLKGDDEEEESENEHDMFKKIKSKYSKK